MSQGTRLPETPCEAALRELLSETPTELSADAQEALAGVDAALTSYENLGVRRLFDAALLARATPEELQTSFGVSLEEAAAYAELFFDRGVFYNDFHAIAYISAQPDDERRLLEDAFSKGFGALRSKFAPGGPVSAESALEQIFLADAQQYLRERGVPVTHKAAKELRALQKSVVATAAAMGKAASPKEEVRDREPDFVIESGPLNPTIDELLSKGVALAQ
jgi:hypothetical protein